MFLDKAKTKSILMGFDTIKINLVWKACWKLNTPKNTFIQFEQAYLYLMHKCWKPYLLDLHCEACPAFWCCSIPSILSQFNILSNSAGVLICQDKILLSCKQSPYSHWTIDMQILSNKIVHHSIKGECNQNNFSYETLLPPS